MLRTRPSIPPTDLHCAVTVINTFAVCANRDRIAHIVKDFKASIVTFLSPFAVDSIALDLQTHAGFNVIDEAHSASFLFAHLALTAFIAISFRLSGVSDAALAGPPFRPPLLAI